MRSVHEVPKRAYINVMEMLVEEEVTKQIKGLPPRILKYLKQTEVETYALNRLPSLYASSEKRMATPVRKKQTRALQSN